MKKLTIEYNNGRKVDTRVYDANTDGKRLYISGRAYYGIADIFSLSLEHVVSVKLDDEVLYIKGRGLSYA